MEKRVKGFLMIILILLIVLVLLFYFSESSDFENSLDECVTDTDCLIVESRCCPCSSGGEDVCVSKIEAEDYVKELKDCSENLLCTQVFSCTVNSCSCINGECVG